MAGAVARQVVRLDQCLKHPEPVLEARRECLEDIRVELGAANRSQHAPLRGAGRPRRPKTLGRAVLRDELPDAIRLEVQKRIEGPRRLELARIELPEKLQEDALEPAVEEHL